MRLIDADELPEVNTIERIEGEREVFVNSWVPATVIWEAPTVEAIPVSFLERLIFEAKQSKELLKEEYRYFTSIYGHTIEPITCDQAISLIEGIIDYWQDKKRRGKENATD